MSNVEHVSQDMCVANGASLVNVETQEEHEFLQSVLRGLAGLLNCLFIINK